MKKLIIIFTISIIVLGTLTIYSYEDIESKVIDLLNFNSQSELVRSTFNYKS